MRAQEAPPPQRSGAMPIANPRPGGERQARRYRGLQWPHLRTGPATNTSPPQKRGDKPSSTEQRARVAPISKRACRKEKFQKMNSLVGKSTGIALLMAAALLAALFAMGVFSAGAWEIEGPTATSSTERLWPATASLELTTDDDHLSSRQLGLDG